MKKYKIIFINSLQKIFAYRFNFIMGRLRNFIVMILMYFLWQSLSEAKGGFAGFSADELFAYVFLSNIIRSFIFGSQSREIAEEINEGWFSKYLISPVNHFLNAFAREGAERAVNFIFSILEVAIFLAVFRPEINLPAIGAANFSAFILSVFLAIILYFNLSYIVSLIAFWSREAMGPRFLYEWILEMASGAYFPLSVLWPPFASALSFLPFPYLVYYPIMILFGRISGLEMLGIFFAQIIFIILSAALARFAWKRGLKRYAGEGI